MGTHPSNPSKDVTSGRTLLDLVTENKALLSTAVSEIYGDKLPFLFKVLSIQKALSIQAHPDKKLAERLHKQDPKNYPGKLLFKVIFLGDFQSERGQLEANWRPIL
jgi:mannose-6-phosphate isomerase